MLYYRCIVIHARAQKCELPSYLEPLIPFSQIMNELAGKCSLSKEFVASVALIILDTQHGALSLQIRRTECTT